VTPGVHFYCSVIPGREAGRKEQSVSAIAPLPGASVKIEYRWQIIFVKHVLTHDEYTRGNWKK